MMSLPTCLLAAFYLLIGLVPGLAGLESVGLDDLLLRAPHFVAEPHDVVYDASSGNPVREVSLRCRATGYPHPSYHWYKHELSADGQSVVHRVDPLLDPRITLSDGTLIVSEPEASVDRGTYYCEASNRFGVVVSRTVRLDFGYIGQFTTKRTREVGREFWGKAIYCDPPPHHPEVLYYWVRESLPNLVEETARVFSSRDGHLYFSSLDPIDRGKYSCVVQSSISDSGHTGPLVTLEVQRHASGQQLRFPSVFPKAFPEAPLAGEDVYLECVAFGYPIPTYSWRRKGDTLELPRNVSFQNYDRVLVLPKIAVEDSGEYVCTAGNGKGLITASVFITVRARPTFKTALHHDVVVAEGTDLEWKCEAYGVPEVRYEWLKNGQPLSKVLDPEESRYSIVGNVLKILSVDPSRDRGIYQCKASNVVGSTHGSWELRILGLPPSFSRHPSEEETFAVEGGNATFTCQPDGVPKPKIKWQRGRNFMRLDGRHVVLASGRRLVVVNVSLDDEGEYSCVASNKYGSAETRTYLRVFGAPVFIRSPPPSSIASFRETVLFDCEVLMAPMLDVVYVWRRNGIRTDDFAHGRYMSGMKPGSLLIRDATTDDSGNFECWAITPLRQISARVHLTVEGTPGPPGGLQILPLNDTRIQLEWTEGAANGKEILSYFLEGRTQWNRTWTNITEAVKPERAPVTGRLRISLNSRSLSAWSHYQFRVIPWNEYGAGAPSVPSPIFNTATDRPRKYPENVGGGGGNIGDLTITWTPLPPQDWSAPGLFYRIFYRPSNRPASDDRRIDLKVDGSAGRRVVRVGDRNFYKPYAVKVQAINGVGEGPISLEVVVFSAEDRPLVVPTKLSAVPHNATALNVSWQLSAELTHDIVRGKLVHFRVKYWRMAKDDPNYEATYHWSPDLRCWLLLVGLRPNTEYAVASMACNGAGCGAESDPFIAKTLKSAPLTAPTSVQIEAVRIDTIRVTWRASPASQEEEPLLGFKVRYWESYQDFASYRDAAVPVVDGELVTDVSGLQPGVPYKLRVLAYSRGGDGRMSSPTLEFQLGDEEMLMGCANATKGLLEMVLLLLTIVILCS